MAVETPKETAIYHVENEAETAAFTNDEPEAKSTLAGQDWDKKEEKAIV